ncbi:MAG: hypothetical protein OXU79_17745 [Gemmatimonadota bacterium]|nr:hypothetical protein [Gemmatimonadota bacterium]
MRAPSSETTIEAVRRIAPAAVRGGSAVACVRSLPGHPNVWKVALGDGSFLIAKQHVFAPLVRGEPHDMLAVEQLVHARLSGAPVPRLYAADTEHDLVFFEWCGDRTLDDVCQEGATGACGRLVVEGFSRIQSLFCARSDDFAPRTFPGCYPGDLRRTWRRTTGSLASALPRLCSRLSGSADGKRYAAMSGTFTELLQFLEQAAPLPGPTDYNARNIVIDPAARSLRFIEFSRIGWDWPERRLTQYTTSHGAGRPDGGIRSVLTPALAARYAALASEYRAEPLAEIEALLDGHHFVFHLLAARTLLDALPDPGHPLLERWRNPEARLAQLRRILSIPLCGDPRTTALRSCFAS